MDYIDYDQKLKEPWNKGKIVGQKAPLKLQDVWAIRVRLQLANKLRDLALFNLAIDSKLRGCDLVKLKLRDIAHGYHIQKRATILQQKTNKPVRFEITKKTREAVYNWLNSAKLSIDDYLFRSRSNKNGHICTKQYTRIVKQWVADIGLDPVSYSTHSLRRTKVTLIYKQTKNIRAVQLLLGHVKLESTIRYLGVEIDDALEIAEQVEV